MVKIFKVEMQVMVPNEWNKQDVEDYINTPNGRKLHFIKIQEETINRG